ncbi:M42 family metallopeptidase [Tumebacillus sp. ITR2]|uniref:M42 family metallopeptidase n=1 Tax=Tumebacillus amylolyticus TaxID=2801339 RepID=A0ABS1J837_9BACL|nr:M42 family metallopeptidase [Tumebacillus amylolyticus]MBL0386414.1 M42 family metallopeptidase [Tumebacillus amylolyticus]
MSDVVKMMKDLTEVDGVPGFEREVREKMQGYLQPLSDEIVRDRLGGILGKKVGQADGPNILVAGHLDEVGWMVTYITDKGYLKFQSLGGWWPAVMLSQRVRIKTSNGDIIGIIGSKAPHVLTAEERGKVTEIKSMFIDIGARDKEDAERMGIRVGDPIIPVSDFFEMRDGEFWAAKALDNRAGCGVAIEVLNQLKDQDHPNVVFSGATVQEEVGLRGAQVMANLVQPDIAFAVDVGLAYDTPGFELYPASCNLGDGPLMMIFDASMVPHVGLRNLVMDTAKELGINLQTDALAGGGTDAGKFHLTGIGCPSIVIGFATRYIHSHTAIMARKDFEQAAELITAVIKKLDKKTVEELHLY